MKKSKKYAGSVPPSKSAETYERATEENMYLDKEGTMEKYSPPAHKQVSDFLKGVGLMDESAYGIEILEAILQTIETDKKTNDRLEECIVVAGEASGGHILVKSRDRNYKSRIRIVRDMTPSGAEVVYFEDLDTGYLEGMNSHGIGVVNAALLVGEDESLVKGKVQSDDGPRMRHALEQSTLQDAIKSLIGHMDGIKGHTFVGNSTSIYSIEMTSKHNPIINKLDPQTGYDVRTNHGHEHTGAGYAPERKPDDYLSSKIRKAQAEVELADVSDFEEIAPALAQQPFEPDSNYNMLRRTPKMVTNSQVAMHLPNQEMIFYYFPDDCDFLGIEDNTPADHSPQIGVSVVQRPDK